MLGRTHVVFGFVLGLLLFTFFDLHPLLFVIITAFISLLPDVDQPNSKLGRRVKIFSKPFSFLFGHRTYTHSIFAMGVLAVLIWRFFDGYFIPFLIGYFGHLVLDAVTKQGVVFTYPFQFLRIRGLIKTGGVTENVFFGALILSAGYLIFTFFS